MAKQLTVVNSESATVVARIVSGAAATLGVLVALKIISVEQAAALLEFANSDLFGGIVMTVCFVVTVLLPAAQGWRNRNKELPAGVTIQDVKLKEEGEA